MNKLVKDLIAWVDVRLPATEFVEGHVTKYMAPKNFNYWWNFGSLALSFFGLQVVTGIFLTMYYKPDTMIALDSIEHIMRDVHFGWLIRYMHAVGPTAIFFAIYVHMGRGLYYGSYKGPREMIWFLGVIIFLMFMAEAFMGYLLPWGQMSFWEATVISNLLGSVPILGQYITLFMRGDFSVGDATLTRFFALHVAVLPFAVIGAVLVLHLTALHRVGSNNPEGLDFDKKGKNMITFFPYYITKDGWFFMFFLTIFLWFIFFQPDFFLEPVNNEPADPLKTPVHIVPEWYFLPFYAILRSIPHKFGGVVAMNGAIIILFLLPYLDRCKVRSSKHRPWKRILTWIFFVNFLLLGYVGFNNPDATSMLGLKFLTLGRICSLYYAFYILGMPVWSSMEPTRDPKRAYQSS